jgi:hypothetical protein
MKSRCFKLLLLLIGCEEASADLCAKIWRQGPPLKLGSYDACGQNDCASLSKALKQALKRRLCF